MLRTAALAVALAACSSKGGGASTTPSNKAETTQPLAAASADALAFLPADSEFVLGIEWATARNSAVYKAFEPEIVGALGNNLTRAQELCGFDPLTSISRVTLGGKVSKNEEPDVVIVVTGVGSQTLECIGKLSGEQEGLRLEKGVLIIDQQGDDEKTVATLVGGTTLVMHVSPTASPDTLDGVLHSGAPLRSSKTFVELYERREANASVWGMINGNSPMLDDVRRGGINPKAIDGTLVLTNVFSGALRMQFGETSEADKVVNDIKQLVPMVQGKVDRIDVRADGAMVRANVVATDAQLRDIFKMLGGFF
jgi:hypothetical protein